MTDKRHSSQGVPEFHQNTAGAIKGRQNVAHRVRTLTMVILLLLLAGLGHTLLQRRAQAEVLAQRATENAVSPVRVVHASSNQHEDKLTLPATLQGQTEAQIYARTSGYVKQWYKDIGQSVKRGERLALLDIPDIDKQVDEAAANHELARIAYERWKRLRAKDAVSQQEYDEKTAAFQQSTAELKRLREQQSFASIQAPFDGIVTRRNIDNGGLVNAGNGGNGQSLFSIAQVDRLHLYVFVPQDRANQVHIGDRVEVRPTNSGIKPILGKVVRTAGAIDPGTRTLQVEILLPNADHQLMPGLYVEAHFNLPHSARLTLPDNALLFGSEGSQVATVDAHNRVKLQKVELGTDFGKEIEIRSGISTTEQVIINPSDAISDGQTVKIVADSKSE